MTLLRQQRHRQAQQRLFMPTGDVLSINSNTVNAGDTGFADWMSFEEQQSIA